MATTATLPAAQSTEGSNRRWWVLSVVNIAVFMAVLDSSIVNVALPGFMRQFDVGLDTAEWISLGYRFMSAVALLPAGRLADIIGRKKVFVAGAAIFTIGSALCVLAPNPELLVAARIFQALGATGLLATFSAILVAVFPAKNRGKALGISGTVAALATAVSPTLGGFLVGTLGPRSVFAVNIPIGIIGLIAAWYVLREHEVSDLQEHREPFDWWGAFLATAALLLLLFAFERRIGPVAIEPIRAFLVGGGLALFALFLWVERRREYPLLDLKLFEKRAFNITALVVIAASAALGINTFLLPLFLQLGLGQTPVQAGLQLIPLSAALAIVGPISGTLSDNVGAKLLTIGGMACTVAALLWTAGIQPGAGYIAVALPLILLGIGGGLYQAPNASVALGAVPRSKLGIAGAVRSTLFSLALAFGVAVGETTISGALAPFGGTQILTGDIAEADREAIVAAYSSAQAFALRIAAGLAAIGLIAAFFLRHRDEPEPEKEEGDDPAEPAASTDRR